MKTGNMLDDITSARAVEKHEICSPLNGQFTLRYPEAR